MFKMFIRVIDIADSILNKCDKSNAFDFEIADMDMFEVLHEPDDGTIQDLNMSIIDSVTPIYKIIEPD